MHLRGLPARDVGRNPSCSIIPSAENQRFEVDEFDEANYSKGESASAEKPEKRDRGKKIEALVVIGAHRGRS